MFAAGGASFAFQMSLKGGPDYAASAAVDKNVVATVVQQSHACVR